MQIEHFILAKDSSIDQEKNSLSVFDYVEDLQINTNQANTPIPLVMQGIAVFRRTEEKGEIDSNFIFQILDPEKKILLNQKISIKLLPEHRRYRMRINFSFLVSRPGEYGFFIFQDGNKEIRRDLSINIQIKNPSY